MTIIKNESILLQTGMDGEAAARVNNHAVSFTRMVVGNANGTLPPLDKNRVSLDNFIINGSIISHELDPSHSDLRIMQLRIGPDANFDAREVLIYAQANGVEFPHTYIRFGAPYPVRTAATGGAQISIKFYIKVHTDTDFTLHISPASDYIPWRAVSNSLLLDSSSNVASSKAVHTLNQKIENIRLANTAISYLNIQNLHFVTQNDGAGNFNIRIGHRIVNVDGEIRAVVTEVGTQFHIHFNNDNVPSGFASIYVAVAYENDGAVGDFITEWRTVAEFNRDEYKLFDDTLRATHAGILTHKGATVVSKSSNINPSDWFVDTKGAKQTFYHCNFGDDMYRNYPIISHLYDIGSQVTFVWSNNGLGRIQPRLDNELDNDNANFYLAGQVTKILQIDSTECKVICTKMSANRWDVEAIQTGER